MADETGPSGRPSWLARLAAQHLHALVFTLGRLWRSPAGSLLTAAVIGVTLALPAGLHILVKNVSAVSGRWQGAASVSLFLKDPVADDRGRQLTLELAKRPDVARTEYVSRERSAAEFRALSGFGDALDALHDNPLPAVIVVTPQASQTPATVDAMARALARLPEVDQVKLDRKWLERLYAVLAIVRRGVWLTAAMLGLAVIVIVGNTIRLDIQNRRDEIVVMKLVGASNAFIRRPFLYTGWWYGLAGGALAWLLVQAGLLALSGPAQRLAGLYQSDFSVSGLGGTGALAVLGGGIALGWLGAFWTVTRHLSRIEPA